MAPTSANQRPEPIRYGELAKMRLRDFLGEGAEIDVEESGMTVVVGLGGYEGLGETFFEWRQGEPYQTAGVTLDLGHDSFLPESAALKIVDTLRLPVKTGMTASELIGIFGTPESDKPGRSGLRLLSFVCGQPDEYRLGCAVDEREGLVHLFLARKDYCDDDEAI